ncbi:hypothetical protein KIPB_001998, partial [Kipferlia bialata]
AKEEPIPEEVAPEAELEPEVETVLEVAELDNAAAPVEMDEDDYCDDLEPVSQSLSRL